MADTLHFDSEPATVEALPYSLELWDEAGQAMESVLATLRNASLGYACYYGALRQYPGRRIVLRLAGRAIANSGAASR